MDRHSKVTLIDTHCHLDFPDFDKDRAEVISRAKEAGVEYIVNIGSSLDGSRRSVELASEYKQIYASVGVHPHEADRAGGDTVELLRGFASGDKVVAIGEIGLDYFKNFSSHENQRKLFISSLELAVSLKLPVVIHSRQAENDVLDIVSKNMPLKAVIHCFSADEIFLRHCLDKGFFVSFTCNITYKKADKLRELLKYVPLDRLMLETDAPYLPPEGLRGRRNEPSFVKELAGYIAAIIKKPLDEISTVTTMNAKGFFNIP